MKLSNIKAVLLVVAGLCLAAMLSDIFAGELGELWDPSVVVRLNGDGYSWATYIYLVSLACVAAIATLMRDLRTMAGLTLISAVTVLMFNPIFNDLSQSIAGVLLGYCGVATALIALRGNSDLFKRQRTPSIPPDIDREPTGWSSDGH